MGWYKGINAILEQEPETWLAYLYGQQLDNMPHLTRRKPKFRGLLLRLCAFGVFLLSHLKLKQPKILTSRADYLVFSGTANQMSSLDGTTTHLTQQGARVVEIAHAKLLKTEALRSRYIPFSYNAIDIVKSLVLLVRRGPALYLDLKRKHPTAITNYFNSFCSVYAHLVYFYRVLGSTNPAFVITANDHNPSNRSLLAVAHYLGIKTVYMQHASVSSLFPALRVNYAFLDGQSAFDIYKSCEENQPPTHRKVPAPQVILTGQKKQIDRRTNREENVVGVALNALDETESAIEFIKGLSNSGLEIIVRWHPGQPKGDIKRYFSVFGNSSRIKLSNPENESISDFLNKIRWLIAGNSSIHLEAALSGVLPIYYEQRPSDSPDYYGYVQHRLAIHAKTRSEIVEIINGDLGTSVPDVSAVRYYSSTYYTEWDGREDELVAKMLLELSEKRPPSVELHALPIRLN